VEISPRVRTLLPFIAVAVLAFAAHARSLAGDFLFVDDSRFVVRNEAIHELTPAGAVCYFTDLRTLSTIGWDGIYRPLRTLDFAIDWAVSGGRPWFFHLRNVLYHVISSLLLLAILRTLLAPRTRPALWGALFFAVHPVHVESVEWITSRGDAMLLTFFLLSLWLYISGRPLAAAATFVVALFSKEAAVIFPGIVLLVDLMRGERPRVRWLALYTALSLLYCCLWFLLVAGGRTEGVGHLAGWWGGSYGANLTTMARGFAYYVQLLILPVRQIFDYHVPADTGFDAGAALGILLLGGIAALGWFRDRRLLFGLAWFAIAILPTANLLYAVGIPTAERFLYLPAVGMSLWVGHLLASSRLRYVVVACLLALAVARSGVWRTTDTLFAATEKVADTPLTLVHQTNVHLLKARAYSAEGDQSGVRSEVDEVVRAADSTCRLLTRQLGGPWLVLGGVAQVRKAEALILVGRNWEAFKATTEAMRWSEKDRVHGVAAAALHRLGRLEEAVREADLAIRGGDWAPHLRFLLTDSLNRLAAQHEAEGRLGKARELYLRSWRELPDPNENPMAAKALQRLGR
jgi:hypothetical protein